MKPLTFAGLASLAALGAQAQTPPLTLKQGLEPVVVTATRTLQPTPTLRDTVVLTREDLDAAGDLSLGELLQRRAGLELRATGGPGQPQGVFIRGAGTAQTLVLVDGLRAGSATQGTTSIENIPLDMIERIEVVKGPLSSLYGSEAAGGVIQIFTRGKGVPYLVGSAGYGTDGDARASAALTTADADTNVSLAFGVRRVDARSATNARNTFSYDPDRDPYENGFANARWSQKTWTGETLTLEGFVSRSRTRYDAGAAPAGIDDRSDQTIEGVRFSSQSQLATGWGSRITLGSARDKLAFNGQFPGLFETRQDQASWINEFANTGGSTTVGLEAVRQTVLPREQYAQDQRDTTSGFVALNQSIAGQRIEASARRDHDDQFGSRNTGSVSYGLEWPDVLQVSGTWARGFRAPTFNDLYLTAFQPFYTPNPDLRPEQSKSGEVSLRSLASASVQWRITGFDNRFDDLIVATAETVMNVSRARIRGVEASLDASWKGTRLRASVTAQRPRDEDTGARLQGRAERFGAAEASHTFGAWTVGVSMLASGDRYDSSNQAPGSRLPGYAVVDARVRYNFAKQWSAELTATNLGDKRYETAVGYDAPRRGVFLNLRFESY